MSKWKNVRTYLEVNPYTGQPVEEDAPTNATGVNVAGTGDDSSVVVVKKKKKTLIDNSEKIKKLEKMLQDLEKKKKKTPGGGFAKMKIKKMIADLKGMKEDVELDEVRISDYVVDTLRDIKRSKSSRNLKLKGGDIKIDMDTANKMLDFLDKMSSMGKKKIMGILDKGTKTDFMKVNQAVMKAVR